MREPIIAAGNPLIQRLRLLHDPGGRRAARAFLVEGRRAIDGCLAAGEMPQELLVRAGEELPATWPDAALRTVSAKVAARLSQATTPSGYLAVFAVPEPPSLVAAAGGIVLHGLGDPGNLGTLLRSATAFGVRQAVCVGGADPYGHKVVQATAGTLTALSLHVRSADDPLADLVGGNDGDGAALCALVVAGGADPATVPRRPRWLVIGSEAHGLPSALAARCAERVTLPMAGAVESLNAAVAGAIALYLLTR